MVPTAAMSDARHYLTEYGGLSWPKIGATHYHAQLGLVDKGCATK